MAESISPSCMVFVLMWSGIWVDNIGFEFGTPGVGVETGTFMILESELGLTLGLDSILLFAVWF